MPDVTNNKIRINPMGKFYTHTLKYTYTRNIYMTLIIDDG